MLLIGIPISSYAIRPRAATGIGYSEPYVNSSQSSLISSYIKIVTPNGSNTLPIKKLSLYEPLHFQFKITRSTAIPSSIQSMLNSLQNSRCSFIFTTLLVHTTTPAIFAKNPFRYFSQISPLYPTLTCSQNHPYNPH